LYQEQSKGLTEIEDGNISAEAGIQGPGPIVNGKNELCFTREARSKIMLFMCYDIIRVEEFTNV